MTGRSSQHSSEQPASAAANQHDRVLSAIRRLWRAGQASAASHPAAAGPEPGPGPQPAAGPEAASGPVRPDGGSRPVSPDLQVSRLLRQAAAWSWRLLLTGLVIYFAFRLAEYLRLVVLPLLGALLFTALFQPLAGWLRRRGAGAASHAAHESGGGGRRGVGG